MKATEAAPCGETAIFSFTASTATLTVTLDANGGSVTPATAQTGADGKAASLPTPTRSGSYRFDGWYLGSALVTLNTVFTNDCTITAQWTYTGGGYDPPVTTCYTLRFDANGGTSIAGVTGASGTTVSLSSYATTRDGYTFGGWYSDSRLTDTVTFVKLTRDTTVYAKWTEKAPVAVTSELPFTDVNTNNWFYDDVKSVYENKLMLGTADTVFNPYLTTTRGMIVTILYRLEGEPAVSGTNPFDDVANGKYDTDAVIWAAANNIVEGYGNGKFGPEDNITREQLAAIFFRCAKYKGCDVSVGEDIGILSYNDAESIGKWAIPAMQWACGTGLIRGDAGNLMPRGEAQRCQVAAILHRFCENAAK